MAVLTKCLTRMRSDFGVRFSDRDETSDGWIGDKAHEQTTSGHNPDETGGGEYEDSDTKDEVRAIDVDDDLRDSEINMQEVADNIIRTPNDIRRLKYMIYNRRIASRSNGWRWESYSGSNPHDKHLHVSGDPAYDEDDSEFTSITKIGDEGMTPEELDDYYISRYQATSGKPLTVRNYLRAFPGTYIGGPFPEGMNALNIWNNTHATGEANKAVLAQIAAKVDISPEELAAIQQSAYEGALAGAANAEEIAAAVVAQLQSTGLTDAQQADVESAVRNVLVMGTGAVPTG